MPNHDRRVRELGLTLPPAPKAVGNYRPAVRVGDLLYLSGHGPFRPDRSLVCGILGDDMETAAGYQAARDTGLAMLATLQAELGTLDRIVQLVKVLGMVRCTADFTEQPRVIDGFSDLMEDVFGDAGRGARSAVGMSSLPAGIAVEVEAVFQITIDRENRA